MSSLTTPVDVSRDHIQGTSDAPVTLVEYGDYECSYCGEAYPIVKKVQAAMGNRLRFVFRNFPLTEMHPHATHAAEAAESADAQGRFWEMHDALYEHQNTLGDHDLATLASGIGIDGNAVLHAIHSSQFNERIQEDFMSGVRSGVNGTPSFFINGVRFDGAWDEATLTKALEQAA